MTSKKNPGLQELNNTVIKGGYCVGCGACASLSGSPIKMALNKFSMFEAKIEDNIPLLDKELDSQILAVCPFSDTSENEDEISGNLYGKTANYNQKIGYYLSLYGGYVQSGGYRNNGSSGGMGTWIASKLFKENYIDAVIHIHSRKPTQGDKRLFHYNVSRTLQEISLSSKSRYYPIELSEVIHYIKNNEGRYVIVGVPCFIKAIRHLSLKDEVIGDRIKYCIGLVCGHLKSTGFAEMLAWQNGIKPTQVTAFDFRKKLEGFGANRYGVEVSSQEGDRNLKTVSPPVNELYGTDWGLGLFKYKACDFCDDVVAETADVTIGDAWLPQYVKDSQGTNILIIRNLELEKIIKRSCTEGELHLDPLTAKEVITSQSSGFEHRREGLSFRLHLADEKKLWRPRKRVEAKKGKNMKFQEKHRLRMELAEKSHTAFKEAIYSGTFELFKKQMEPTVQEYRNINKKNRWEKLFNLSKNAIKNVVKA